MSFDSKNDKVSLSDTLAKCLNMEKGSNTCDLKPYGYNNRTKTTTNTNITETINNDKCTNAKAGYAATMRSTILLITTFCCFMKSSTVFYQLYLGNKRIYLNTRALQRYVCMNECNGSYKVVNILQNDKKMDLRASSYAPNILKQTGFRIPNLSRLTIYLTKLYRTILIPILFLSNDHIKTLPVSNGYVFSLNIYFDSCLLIVL